MRTQTKSKVSSNQKILNTLFFWYDPWTLHQKISGLAREQVIDLKNGLGQSSGGLIFWRLAMKHRESTNYFLYLIASSKFHTVPLVLKTGCFTKVFVSSSELSGESHHCSRQNNKFSTLNYCLKTYGKREFSFNQNKDFIFSQNSGIFSVSLRTNMILIALGIVGTKPELLHCKTLASVWFFTISTSEYISCPNIEYERILRSCNV